MCITTRTPILFFFRCPVFICTGKSGGAHQWAACLATRRLLWLRMARQSGAMTRSRLVRGESQVSSLELFSSPFSLFPFSFFPGLGGQSARAPKFHRRERERHTHTHTHNCPRPSWPTIELNVGIGCHLSIHLLSLSLSLSPSLPLFYARAFLRFRTAPIFLLVSSLLL